MYHIRFSDYSTETEIFSYSTYAPPCISHKDLIRIAEMKQPDFPDEIYMVNEVFYEFNKNSTGEIGVFVNVLITKIEEQKD